MTIKVDKKKCMGCGACVGICSEVFKMGKDGKAEVKTQKKLPCVEEAINSCPMNAISE